MRERLITIEVFAASYVAAGANTKQSRAVRAERIQPFVAWARARKTRSLPMGRWQEELERFLSSPA